MTKNEELFSRALAFVKEKHAGKVRAGNDPTWHHLYRVARTLEMTLREYDEGDARTRDLLPVAALGHDVLEDTDATEHEVRSVFGDEGYEIIWGMTNEWGDDHVGPYIEKVVTAAEPVRLVKLSDLYDNISNVLFCFPILGEEWTRSYFLPIVTPMRERITQTDFSKFPKTAAELKRAVEKSATLLDERMHGY